MRHSYVFQLIVGVVVAMVGCVNVWGEECNYGSTAESDDKYIYYFVSDDADAPEFSYKLGTDGKPAQYYPAQVCDAKRFRGWSTMPVKELVQEKPTLVDFAEATFNSNQNFYAVYAVANEVEESAYEKKITETSNKMFLIMGTYEYSGVNMKFVVSPNVTKTLGGNFQTSTNSSLPQATITTDRKINDLKKVEVGFLKNSNKVILKVQISEDEVSWTDVDSIQTNSKISESQTLTAPMTNYGDFYVRIMATSKAKDNYYVEISSVKFFCANRYEYSDYSTNCKLSTEETEMCVEEWYSNKLLFSEPVALTDISVKLNGVSQDDIISVSRKTYSNTYNLYELSGIDFAAAAGYEMVLTKTTSENNCTSVITVPTFVRSVDAVNASTLADGVDVVVRDGGILTINDNKTLGVLTIHPNSKVIVPKGVTLTVDALTFFGGIEDENKYGVPELVLNGTIVSTADRILYRMRVDAEQMYTIAFPYDVQVADIRRPDGLAIREGENWTGNLWMSTYNGENRAKGGRRNNSETNSWKQDAALGNTLTAGVGYTVSAPRLRAQSKYAYSLIDFPMAIPMLNEQTEGDATIAAELKSIKGKVGVTFYKNDAVGANNRTDWGWNLLANPYMSTISGGDYRMKVGEKDYDVITMLTDDGEGYYQFVFDGNSEPLRPFKHFFLQVGEDGTFCFYPLLTTSAPRYLTAQEEGSADFALTISGDNTTDISYFRLNNRYTDEYEIGADVVKMCSAPTQLYSLFGEEGLFRMATVAENNKLISLGYQAAMSGSFTFAMAANAAINNVEHIYLLENGDVVADLMNESYTFETSVGTNNDRFAIRIVMRTEQTPTRLGGEEERRIGGGIPPHKRLIEGNVLIVVNGAIYNAEGRKVTK